MGILQGYRQSQRDRIVIPARVQLSMPDGVDDTMTRDETEIFATRKVQTDPYVAWLERKVEREAAERPPIRWVHGASAVKTSEVGAGS